MAASSSVENDQDQMNLGRSVMSPELNHVKARMYNLTLNDASILRSFTQSSKTFGGFEGYALRSNSNLNGKHPAFQRPQSVPASTLLNADRNRVHSATISFQKDRSQKASINGKPFNTSTPIEDERVFVRSSQGDKSCPVRPRANSAMDRIRCNSASLSLQKSSDFYHDLTSSPRNKQAMTMMFEDGISTALKPTRICLDLLTVQGTAKPITKSEINDQDMENKIEVNLPTMTVIDDFDVIDDDLDDAYDSGTEQYMTVPGPKKKNTVTFDEEKNQMVTISPRHSVCSADSYLRNRAKVNNRVKGSTKSTLKTGSACRSSCLKKQIEESDRKSPETEMSRSLATEMSRPLSTESKQPQAPSPRGNLIGSEKQHVGFDRKNQTHQRHFPAPTMTGSLQDRLVNRHRTEALSAKTDDEISPSQDALLDIDDIDTIPIFLTTKTLQLEPEGVTETKEVRVIGQVYPAHLMPKNALCYRLPTASKKNMSEVRHEQLGKIQMSPRTTSEVPKFREGGQDSTEHHLTNGHRQEFASSERDDRERSIEDSNKLSRSCKADEDGIGTKMDDSVDEKLGEQDAHTKKPRSFSAPAVRLDSRRYKMTNKRRPYSGKMSKENDTKPKKRSEIYMNILSNRSGRPLSFYKKADPVPDVMEICSNKLDLQIDTEEGKMCRSLRKDLISNGCNVPLDTLKRGMLPPTQYGWDGHRMKTFPQNSKHNYSDSLLSKPSTWFPAESVHKSLPHGADSNPEIITIKTCATEGIDPVEDIEDTTQISECR